MRYNENLVSVDTSVFIELFKDESLLDSFILYLNERDLRIIITDILSLELVRRQNYHRKYYEMIRKIPHVLALPVDKLTECEILSCPNPLKRSIEYFECYESEETIKQLFLNRKIDEANKLYEYHQTFIINRVDIFKNNESLSPDQVAFRWVENTFLNTYPSLLKQFKDKSKRLEAEKVPSVWLQAHVAYDKYITYGVEAIESDLGDFLHITYMPYCSLVLTEEKMNKSLNKIKVETQSPILKDVDFRDIKFIRKLK